MLGDEPRPAPPPGFWSDQYGVRIQYAGHAHVADEVRLAGEDGEDGFAALYHREGRAIAGLAVGRPREFAAMRRLLESEEELQPTEESEAPTKELVT
jgi:3-phenylpropionate/trans-cinnamate dioxygenase ferredoxin reductase subunit